MDQVDLARNTLAQGTTAQAPRIYALHPLQAGKLHDWCGHLRRISALGFSHVLTAPVFAAQDVNLPSDFDRPHPALDFDGDASELLHAITQLCHAEGLEALLDVALDRLDAGSPHARERPDLFDVPARTGILDPRRDDRSARARWEVAADGLAMWWAERLGRWRDAGITGFRLCGLPMVPASGLRSIVDSVRRRGPVCFMGWTPGVPRPAIAALHGCGLDFLFSSLPWWDWRAEWLWTEAENLRSIAPVIAAAEAPFGPRLADRITDPSVRPAAALRAIRFAAAFGDGWLMPMGFENLALQHQDGIRDTPEDFVPGPTDLSAAIRTVNASVAEGMVQGFPPRLLSGPGADRIVFRRGLVVTEANADLGRRHGDLPPACVVTQCEEPAPPITASRPAPAEAARMAAESPRVGIEAVTPSVEGGRFAAKRLAGQTVTVEADVLCDGHEQIGVALLWRAADETGWHEARMRPLGNDRWRAAFPVPRVGRYEFVVEAWRDAFATFRDELAKKHAVALNVHVELAEGRHLLAAAAERDPAVQALSERLAAADDAGQIALLLSGDAQRLMQVADDRPFAMRTSPHPVYADRSEAEFASWYEIFPRSMSDDPHRHGTFRDVIRHLPRIRDMGFDVLYFPPVHPIGRINRKGRNNSLRPAPDDPGSPYAIGAAEGGHDALHPELGTFEDFSALRAAAAEHGLELALDFAIQCSPDHPWLKQHPGWFAWRPDGSIRYAENPPKKYEDIVNVDFYGRDAVPDLWVALCDVVLHWCDHGVRIFRVDNPHTKPFPFWEWLIGEVQARHPDALFLAEAFTRPKIMYRLGKIGFSQSYTYFTWRNTRRELEEYLTELTTGPARDFYRPNFFVNTPDINPIFLQTSGRPGFLMRAVLAATLSGSWGVYCGFELCEGTPVPGKEEYLDSEKYQLRAWDWNRPGNIVAEITALNRIRRHNPALWSHLGVSFLASSNDHVMFYEKATPDRGNVVLVAVSLDPAQPQTSDVDLPMWKWNLPDAGALVVDDLVTGDITTWNGRWQRLSLTPSMPYAIFRARPAT